MLPRVGMDGVPEMSVRELARRLAADGDGVLWLDVRTEGELALARIPGFRRLDAELAEALAAGDREAELVFLCHHGVRSEAAARHFRGLGFRRVWNVSGGIDAWSREIDPSVPRY